MKDTLLLAGIDKDEIYAATKRIAIGMNENKFKPGTLLSRAEGSVRILRSAMGLAQELNMTPEDVFKMDNLYYEAVRRSYDIAAFVTEYISLFHATSPGAIKKLRQRILDEVIYLNPRISLEEDLESHEVSNEAQRESLAARRLAADIIIRRTEMIWGNGATNALPAELRMTLLFPAELNQ